MADGLQSPGAVRGMKKPGSFSETIACPLCGARVFVNYKGRVSMARCLVGHLIFIREKIGINDYGKGVDSVFLLP